MSKKAKRLRILIAFLAICLIGIIAYEGYTNKLNDYMVASTFDTLKEIADQQKFNVQQRLSTDVQELEDFALAVGFGKPTAGEMISDEIIFNDFNSNAPSSSAPASNSGSTPESSQLTAAMAHTHFTAVNYYDLNGNRLASAGIVETPPEASLFAEALEKGTVISVFQQADKKSALRLLTTVTDSDSKVIAVITGTQSAERLQDVLLPFFQNQGVTYLVNQSGDFLVASQGKGQKAITTPKSVDFWSGLETVEHLGYDSVSEMQEKIAANQSGSIIFNANGQKRFACYEPIGISDWYVVTVMDNRLLIRNVDTVARNALGLSLIIISAFVVLLLYILHLQRKYSVSLERIAYYDELCECPNLRKFRQNVQKLINEHPNKEMLMVKFDIDQFKLVNQRLGEKMGNQILVNLVRALKANSVKGRELYGRAHDDEFFILHLYDNIKELPALRKQIIRSFYRFMGEDFHYHIKIISGHYYMGLEKCVSADVAIEKANVAHRRAKLQGMEVCVYNESFVKDALRKKEIEEWMEDALRKEEYQVYFQAQYSLSDGEIVGAEALVRWQCGDGTMIYPNEFIPIFEENRFIIRLDLYMFEQVCRVIRSWMDEGYRPVPISVNFSMHHLADIRFVDELCQIADEFGVPRRMLEVELTERVISQNEEVSLHVLSQLHENGFTLAMDDFGTGYSSLGLLKNVPVDIIKIDKSFFDQADDQPRTKAVLMNVLRLARDLKAYTIAEGVEIKETADLLRGFGCDAVQGYYYARPVCEAEFRKALLSNTNWVIA